MTEIAEKALKLLKELSIKQAPPELIRSVGYLLDDDVATRALTTLKGNDDGG